MNKYTELKIKHEKEFSEFPIAFAFSNSQLKEAMEKLKVKSKEELLSVSGGGLIRKTDIKWYCDFLIKHANECNKMLHDDDYLFQGFLYELANHEYCNTYDPEDTLDCFGLSIDKIKKDERMRTIFNKAVESYLSMGSW